MAIKKYNVVKIRPRGNERGLIAGWNPFMKGVALWLKDDLTVKYEVVKKGGVKVIGQIVSAPLTLNEWAHITATYVWETGSINLYIDGVAVGEQCKCEYLLTVEIVTSLMHCSFMFNM